MTLNNERGNNQNQKARSVVFVSPSSISSINSNSTRTSITDDDMNIESGNLPNMNSSSEYVIKHRNLGPHGGYLTAQKLKKNTKVKNINLSENALQDEGIIYVSVGLRLCTEVTSLIVANNLITEYGFRVLLDSLNGSKIKVLNVASNPIGNNIDGLRKFLESTSLEELNISSINLEEEGAKILGVALSLNKSLKKLEVGWNHIRMNGAALLCKGLSLNTSIEEINLCYNGLGLEGAIAIGDCLTINQTLQKVDLTCNRFTVECVTNIASALSKNSTLAHIELGNNAITTSGVYQLLTALLKGKSNVKYLGLKNVPILKHFPVYIELIQQKREFNCEYGPIITGSDAIGSKNLTVDDDPIIKLAKYLAEKRLRIIDLYRLMDKKQMLKMEKLEFIKRLKIFEPRLKMKDVCLIAENVAVDSDTVDYSNLFRQVHQARNEILLQENSLIKQRLSTLKKNKVYLQNIDSQFKMLLEIHKPVAKANTSRNSSSISNNSFENNELSTIKTIDLWLKETEEAEEEERLKSTNAETEKLKEKKPSSNANGQGNGTKGKRRLSVMLPQNPSLTNLLKPASKLTSRSQVQFTPKAQPSNLKSISQYDLDKKDKSAVINIRSPLRESSPVEHNNLEEKHTVTFAEKDSLKRNLKSSSRIKMGLKNHSFANISRIPEEEDMHDKSMIEKRRKAVIKSNENLVRTAKSPDSSRIGRTPLSISNSKLDKIHETSRESIKKENLLSIKPANHAVFTRAMNNETPKSAKISVNNFKIVPKPKVAIKVDAPRDNY